MHKRKVLILAVIFFIIIGIGNIVYGKYITNNIFTIAKVNIESKPPEIELIEVTNTNTGYESYANKTHIINAKIKVTEKNIKQNNFNKENIEILVDNNKGQVGLFEIEELERKDDYIIYNLKLNKIEGNGILEILVKEGTIIDIQGNKNEETRFDLNILIDNIFPNSTAKEEKLQNGKSKITIDSNEKLRPVNAWNLSSSKNILTKEFPSITNYDLPITDYAQNTSKASVKVENATYITLGFGAASVKNNKATLYEINNKCIVGAEIMQKDPICKIEMITFYKKGEITDDFLQMQAYSYTYWGEKIEAIGASLENRFCFGYNPSENKYGSIKEGPTATLKGNKNLILGGDGVNIPNAKGIGGKPIPQNIANKYLYGISSIKMKLKEYANYSIVYQVWVNGSGWQNTVSDGGEAKLSYTKPFTAFRVTLVPKTEKQHVINTWNGK